jgi:hypothetical protein
LNIATHSFDYSAAFSRNIGWVTEPEQAALRSARIAIAGLGGVGGAHLLTLCRLGIAQFNIADFDHFEVHNFNRQAGASMPFLGQPKVDVLAQLALDVNPENDSLSGTRVASGALTTWGGWTYRGGGSLSKLFPQPRDFKLAPQILVLLLQKDICMLFSRIWHQLGLQLLAQYAGHL